MCNHRTLTYRTPNRSIFIQSNQNSQIFCEASYQDGTQKRCYVFLRWSWTRLLFCSNQFLMFDVFDSFDHLVNRKKFYSLDMDMIVILIAAKFVIATLNECEENKTSTLFLNEVFRKEYVTNVITEPKNFILPVSAPIKLNWNHKIFRFRSSTWFHVSAHYANLPSGR